MCSSFRATVVAALAAATIVVAPSLSAVDRIEVNHAYVQAAAQKLAGERYKPRRADIPRFLRELTYDDYRRIRFIPENSLWSADALPFRVQFFHPGYIHSKTVTLTEFTGTHAQRLPFVRAFFDYQDLRLPRLPGSLEYAGFRVLHQLNQPEKWDEVVSFLGASYFRALGKGQRYGLSARGIALGTGQTNEEFPDFVEFWLGKPTPDAKALTIHALLDGPSVTGAFTFVLTPGEETLVDVHATLFSRQPQIAPGIAPLTSMYWYGENAATRHGDFRPEVHDSDGLLVAPDPETRIWRPLANPRDLRITDFDTPKFAGFGLLQRDREFRSYEDLESRFEHRPGVWIEPSGTWPAGRVRLVEIPTVNEYVDNMVAFWMPAAPLAPGQPLDLSYRMRWTSAPSFGGPTGWTRASRQTVQAGAPGRTKFVVDFASAGLESIPASADVQPEVTVEGAELLEKFATRNEIDGSWRMVLRLNGAPNSPPVNIRARLLLEGKPVTETWSTVWQP